MRRILICTGVLGGGTVLTFAAAALAATLMPSGAIVQSSSFGGVVFDKGVMVAPAPMPVTQGPVTIIAAPNVGAGVAPDDTDPPASDNP